MRMSRTRRFSVTRVKPVSRQRCVMMTSPLYGDFLNVPGMVSCTLPAALNHLAAGHRALFDDGRIHAEDIRKNGPDYLLRIVRTQKESVKLRAEKGINLPDTRTKVPSLTAE